MFFKKNVEEVEQVPNYERISFKAKITLFYSLFGTLLPFAIAVLILLIFSKYGSFFSLVDKGDFYLYSAGLLSTAVYLLNDNKESLSRKEALLYPSAIICIVFAAVIYGILYATNNIFSEKVLAAYKIHVNTCFIRFTSFTLLALAIYITYRAIYIETKKYLSVPDVEAVSRENIDKIKTQLDGSKSVGNQKSVDNIMDQLG